MVFFFLKIDQLFFLYINKFNVSKTRPFFFRKTLAMIKTQTLSTCRQMPLLSLPLQARLAVIARSDGARCIKEVSFSNIWISFEPLPKKEFASNAWNPLYTFLSSSSSLVLCRLCQRLVGVTILWQRWLFRRLKRRYCIVLFLPKRWLM